MEPALQNLWHYKHPMYGYWQTKVLVQNDYTYATTGNRLTNALSDWTGPLRTEQYGYDELSRLTSVNYGDGQTQGYTFDPMGNRLTKTDNVTGNETYGYNAANMLTVRNGSGRVAGPHYCGPAPSEPCVRVSPHTAQASRTHPRVMGTRGQARTGFARAALWSSG
jgi:YD repeat-containing protein